MASSQKTKDSAELTEKESLNEKPAFRLEGLESGKYTPQPGWLKEIWGKWPGMNPLKNCLRLWKHD